MFKEIFTTTGVLMPIRPISVAIFLCLTFLLQDIGVIPEPQTKVFEMLGSGAFGIFFIYMLIQLVKVLKNFNTSDQRSGSQLDATQILQLLHSRDIIFNKMADTLASTKDILAALTTKIETIDRNLGIHMERQITSQEMREILRNELPNNQ